jgi:hypothetical protein
MMKKLVIYPDKIKGIVAIAVYLFFLFCLVEILIVEKPSIFISIVVIILAIFALYAVVTAVKTMIKGGAHLSIDEYGINNYRRPDSNLRWKEVKKVELTIENTALQLIVFGIKKAEYEGREIISPIQFSLNGIQYRKKFLKQIYVNIQSYSKLYNDQIIFNETSPILKRRSFKKIK